ncbi:MAG: glycosyltransferase family 4 protein [Frankiaceae bacterium]|nr:glycosyltransferase family 4 protein [Frankiaceae bacterium]MBV9871274.1 glycosyltransferase family 4 protein [Frankiaceae bacterium]
MSAARRVLQVHNGQLTRGGSDTVIAHEAHLLRSAGLEVEQYILPATASPGLAGAIKPTYNRAAMKAVADRIAAVRPDVVHVHTPFPLLSPWVFRTARSGGCATVGTLHSYRYSCIAATAIRDGAECTDCFGRTVKWPGVVHRCYHDSAAASGALTLSLGVHKGLGTFRHHVDRFIALSDFARAAAIRDGLPAAKVVVKPNSVPDPQPDLGVVGDGVLFMGRLVPQKGVGHLLEAWRRAGDTLPPLVIAGDGPMRAEVEAAAATVNISFLGWLEESDLEAHLARCRLVVVPSLWQEGGQPLTMIRALAAGRRSVVPDLANFGGPHVDSGAVRTYATGDADSLAAAVREAYDGAGDRSIREAARSAYAAAYSDPANQQALLRVYADALGQR